MNEEDLSQEPEYLDEYPFQYLDDLDEAYWLDEIHAGAEMELPDDALWMDEEDLCAAGLPGALQEGEKPDAQLENEIEAGIYVLKDCVKEMESWCKPSGRRQKPARQLDLIEDLAAYAARLAGLVRIWNREAPGRAGRS